MESGEREKNRQQTIRFYKIEKHNKFNIKKNNKRKTAAIFFDIKKGLQQNQQKENTLCRLSSNIYYNKESKVQYYMLCCVYVKFKLLV